MARTPKAKRIADLLRALADEFESKRKPPGRKPISGAEEERRDQLLDDWDYLRDQDHYSLFKFCKEKKVTKRYMIRCLNWRAQQIHRANRKSTRDKSVE